MSEYEISWIVVISITTLVGLFFAVGNPIIKLNSTITKLMTDLLLLKVILINSLFQIKTAIEEFMNG